MNKKKKKKKKKKKGEGRVSCEPLLTLLKAIHICNMYIQALLYMRCVCAGVSEFRAEPCI